MRGFETNNCRVCEKVFCCEKCRIKHETNYHEIFPGCDICVYGNFVFQNIEDTYLQHLKAAHLPLNCIYCKKVFASIEDIVQHKKCPVLQRKNESPKTPFNQVTPAILISTGDQDSPILQELQRKEELNYLFNLATSTPMHKGQEPNIIFDKIKESLTPVDKSPIVNKSIIKKTDSVKSENSSKRRVTFGDTPSNNNIKEKSLNFEDTKLSANTSYTPDYEKKKVIANTSCTPVTGTSATQFYSAKGEIEQFYSAKTVMSEEGRTPLALPEGFTPICISNKVQVKGNIYKGETNSPTEVKEHKSGMSETSKHICTPASLSKELKEVSGKSNEERSENFDDQCDTNESELSIPFCTPAKPSAKELREESVQINDERSENFTEQCSTNKSELLIPFYTPANPNKMAVKESVFKLSESANTQNVSPMSQSTEEYNNNSSDKENNPSPDSSIPEIPDTGSGKTLWLTATNLEDSNDSHNSTNENPDVEKRPAKFEFTNSPPKPSKRRVSIVIPTPIVKRTNVHMKLHIPTHFSSTPIMSSGMVKMKETKIVEETSTRVSQQQTLFKTPQGEFTGVGHRRFHTCETISGIEASPSTTKTHYSSNETNPCRDLTTNEHQDSLPSSVTGNSVSSMTESTLWTSMTRIVKSVLGFNNTGSNFSVSRNSASFKRQLSDTDSSGDFLEAPRLKRFKFTDIKCRKPIRDLPALEAPRRLPPAVSEQVATIEIVKSVSTLYGAPKLKIHYDKATQTDDYLMYGWHPKI